MRKDYVIHSEGKKVSELVHSQNIYQAVVQRNEQLKFYHSVIMSYITNTKYRPQLAEQRERMRGEDMHVKGVGKRERENVNDRGREVFSAHCGGWCDSGCPC